MFHQYLIDPTLVVHLAASLQYGRSRDLTQLRTRHVRRPQVSTSFPLLVPVLLSTTGYAFSLSAMLLNACFALLTILLPTFAFGI